MIRLRGKGVTLVEIMMAFFVVVTAIFGAIGALEYGHKATRSDFRRGEAIQIMTDRMNKLSALPFKKLKEFIDSAGGLAEIASEFEHIEFGETTIGNNTYMARATLEYLPLTFKGLMELEFPNPKYKPKDASTWIMKKRSDEAFDGTLRPYQAIKVCVYVKPINYDMEKTGKARDEGEVSAVTYVAKFKG